MNWLKKLFNWEQAAQPTKKEIFLLHYDFYYGCREMKTFEVHNSQAGFYIERGKELIFLREKGELHPTLYDKGAEDFKAKWYPKSGWSTNELGKLKIISQEETDRDIKLIYNYGKT